MEGIDVRYDKARESVSNSMSTLALMISLSFFAAALAIALADPASAHRNPAQPPSLNGKNDVIYRCFSNNYCGTYSWSRGPWNNQPGEPSVNVQSSTTGTSSLYVGEDFRDPNTDTVAQWDATYDPDLITNNNYYMVGYGSNARHVVSTHEFGHAFGLMHVYYMGEGDNTDYCRNSVMYPNVNSAFKCGQTGYLESHDKRDWVALWGTD